MANTILAFDELDASLGSFFAACRDDLNRYFQTTAYIPRHIASNALNDLTISMTTEQFSSFVFAAYSHGDTTCLAKKGPWRPYASISQNGAAFKNSFVYTFSCSSGKEFGKQLIDHGCLCFIGYNEPIAIWDTYILPFIICANIGLVQFFSGFSTQTIVAQMKEQYSQEIDNIYQSDYMIASILRENRDALVLHGEDISIANFQ